MRENLSIGSKIILNEIGTEKKFTFEIQDVIGMGASCIVYTAIYRDAEQNVFTVRLKECFPDGLNISRNGATLTIPVENAERFQKHIQHFTDGYQKQIAFRNFLESQNSISNIQGIFEGNGTKYIAMSCQNGIRLDRSDLSLYDAFRVLRAVTQQIQNFHEHGWVYLDLKPENVILYPETPELVMLFDFDSAVQISEIKPEYISFTKSWSAPEVVQRKVQSIGICSDVYSIGTLLLYLIFGRSPELSDRRKRASWDFDNSILSEESPEVKRMVTELLTHTLSTDIRVRYSSCEEILDVIEPFIESFQKQKPYLKTVLPMNNNFFCGRDREIDAIHTTLQDDTNFLVLHGIGGIGKSELAKHYATIYSDCYDAVIFVHFQNSIIETVASDALFPVVNLERSENESDTDYFARKLKVLQKITTPRHLIILDNFDTDECENLDELLVLKCKFLITSRVDFEDVFPQLEVDVLDEVDDLRTIFSRYSKLEPDDDIDNIIYALSGHTMAIELVSKQMKVNNISSEEMYKKLCEHGISADDNKVKNLKDGTLRNKTAYDHVEILFSIFDLNEDEKQVLRYVALIGSNAMEISYFLSLCEFSDIENYSFERLIHSGWIQTEKQDDLELMLPHSLVVDVLCHQLQPDSESCRDFVINAAAIAAQIDLLESADQRSANIHWLDHMTEHIKGQTQELAYFFKCMIYPVYLGEYNFRKVMDTAERELDILRNSEMKGWVVTALFFARSAADKLHDVDAYQKYDAEIKNMSLSDDYYVNLLHSDLLNAIGDYDLIRAKNAVVEEISIAETTGKDKLLASAYSNAVWFENAFNAEIFDKSYYAELSLKHLLNYYDTHLCNFESDSKELAELYSDIGDAYRDCELYENAIEFYEKGLDTIQLSQEEKQDYFVTAYSAIAVCYQKLLDYEMLIDTFEKALSLSIEYYGKKHWETIQIMINYSNSLIEVYNASLDKLILVKCRSIYEELFVLYVEPNEIQYHEIRLKYASVLSELEDYDASNMVALEVCKWYQETFCVYDEQLIRVYSFLGDLFLKQGDKENAEKYYDLLLQTYEENDMDTNDLKDQIESALSEL